MPSVFEAGTVEEAIQKASNALSIPQKKLNVEVLSYGSTGIFGLVGKKKARIRVQTNSRQIQGDNKAKKEAVPQEVTTKEDLAQEVTTKEDLPRQVTTKEDLAQEVTTKEDLPRQVTEKPDTEAEESTPRVPLEEIGAFAKENLAYILDKVTDHSAVTSTIEDQCVALRVESDSSALLIGKHGQTIDALQYLIQKIVHKKYPGHIPVILDIENYRNRREASLTSLALHLAEKVKHSGKSAAMKPMNPYERRIVHLALQPVREVTSKSRGTGHLKQMIIFPHKNSRSSRSENSTTKKTPKGSELGTSPTTR